MQIILRFFKNVSLNAFLQFTFLIADASNYFDTQGPSFSHEPTSRIEFTNNVGSVVDCIAHGNPPPNVEWLDKDNNPITSISKVSATNRFQS